MGTCLEINKKQNQNYITNQPEPIPSAINKVLLEQGETNVCKIYKNNEFFGSGFFCNIQIDDWNNYAKVIMTNNHVLNNDDIQPYKTINFSIKNDTKFHEILIDNTREIYTDTDYDITIIEIKKDDGIDEISFFEIDDKIFKEEKESFRNLQIFLIHFPMENCLYHQV